MISFIAILLALALGVVVGAVGYALVYFYKLKTSEDFYVGQELLIGIIGQHHGTKEQ